MSHPHQPEIEALAYLIWQQQGCPENRSSEHWIEAEYQILSRSLIHVTDEAQIDNDLHSRGLGPL
jgi:hypothetical protein